MGISKDGALLKKLDELVHEQEIIVKLNGEVQIFYCIPVDLEEMIAGHLKSRGLGPSSCRIKKLSSTEFEVNFREQPGKALHKCRSQKKLTKYEVFESVERLNQNSILYRRTGCTHVIGIRGGKEVFVEDISRHCAIDKAIGLALRDGINLADGCLITSCRQTASTMRKAIYCQIPIVMSIAAPTDLAIQQANEYRVTLIGFASSERFNIYSHDWRIEI
ncbi:MAG: formate dehydrogenase accessory sulfurtransferase FdhD [Dehalococcoidia bacterium]